MRKNIIATVKRVIASAILLVTIASTPVTAFAASAERTATVAVAQATIASVLPEGTHYDNSMSYVSTVTINGAKYVYTGYGCVGFALQLEETAFGKGGSYTRTANAPVASIEAGDIVRVPSAEGGHTFVIISMDENGATIAEANYNSSVHYGRYVTNAELATNTYVMHRV